MAAVVYQKNYNTGLNWQIPPSKRERKVITQRFDGCYTLNTQILLAASAAQSRVAAAEDREEAHALGWGEDDSHPTNSDNEDHDAWEDWSDGDNDRDLDGYISSDADSEATDEGWFNDP